MARTRIRTIGAKLTDAEYLVVSTAAEGKNLGRWAREVLLAASARPSTEQLLLSEIVALRTIVVNVQFALANGELLTNESMHRLIGRADREKLQQAHERLTAASAPRRQ